MVMYKRIKERVKGRNWRYTYQAWEVEVDKKGRVIRAIGRVVEKGVHPSKVFLV